MPRPRRNKRRSLFFLFSLLILGGVVWFAWSLGAGGSAQKDIVITEGMGAGEIADMLAEEGIVRSGLAFNLYGYLTGARARLQAGAFTIPARADVAEIVALLTEGAGVEERAVRLIEGWTIEEMDAYLAKENVFDEGAFSSAASAMRKKCALHTEACAVVGTLLEKTSALEGYLFPDTYRLYADATPEDLVEKMLIRFGEKIGDEAFQAALHASGRTLHEAVTMASIIEAEVAHPQDRAIVSGILWKRIDAGMPLQVDATVNYLTGKSDPSASAADLKINSPYNTYLYPDLPPGPIGNPGMEALMAAVQPKDSPYWFYLSAKDGTTIFSRTFDEHKAAKERFLR